MPVEMLSPLTKTDLPPKGKKSNAQKDWKRIEIWASKLLESKTVNDVLSIEQATIETEIKTLLWERIGEAKGKDCIADQECFLSAFAGWKTAFCQQNARETETPVSFFSIVEADLLQRNLTEYQNGDHSPNCVEVLVFYFRKLAGRNFLKLTTPDQLFPKGNPEGKTWTAAELTAIKEQLNEQFFNCIHELEPELKQAIKEKHELLQKSKNDVLWWLADACVQNKKFSDILNEIIYYCYDIKQNDARMAQAMWTLSETYGKYNPLAGNFVVIYSRNFKSWGENEDDIDRKKRERKGKIKKALQDKYEGEKLEREIERRLSVFNETSIDAPLNREDGDSIGSLLPSTERSITEQIEGIQQAYLILQACADTVKSKKHLKTNTDDLFFTEILSERIRKDENIAKHVQQKQRFYTDACNLDFLNFYLQKSVMNIYDSRCIPLKRIQSFHPEEEKPEYNRACGFPLENIVYQQFIQARNVSNISGKRDTFRKHMRDCLKNADLYT
ncbi:MAG: hypothetical protein Q4D37_01610 [Oscillospiraceae bacterium]|nr:hypothetical protein [Oscillospiraceae bacterium]